MTAWARLTWQVADPAALAADLERRLGPGARAHAELGGARTVRLGGGDLELVTWRREASDDEPHPSGRLVFEPLDPGPEEFAAADSGEPGAPGVPLAVPAFRLAGVGWATVELDRAEKELGPWLEPPGEAPSLLNGVAAAAGEVAIPDVPEPHLGARTRIRRSPGLPGDTLVLSEPVTEGRLAAALARDGEGPCALYLEPAEGLERWLAVAASLGVDRGPIRPGPLGPSVLLAGPPSGPYLLVIERRVASSPEAPGGTIAP